MTDASRSRGLPHPSRLLALATDNWPARGYLAVVAASVAVMFLFPESGFAADPLLLTAPLSFLGVVLPFGPGTEGGGTVEVLATGFWIGWLLLCALVNAAVIGALVARSTAARPSGSRAPLPVSRPPLSAPGRGEFGTCWRPRWTTGSRAAISSWSRRRWGSSSSPRTCCPTPGSQGSGRSWPRRRSACSPCCCRHPRVLLAHLAEPAGLRHRHGPGRAVQRRAARPARSPAAGAGTASGPLSPASRKPSPPGQWSGMRRTPRRNGPGERQVFQVPAAAALLA